MSTTTTSPSAPSWLKYNAGTIGLSIIFCLYAYYDLRHKGVEKPPVPTFAVEAKAYRDSLGPRFLDASKKIKSGDIASKEDIITFLSGNANNMAKAIDDLVDSNVDKSNGKITNRQPLIDAFEAAAENLGVHSK